MHTNTAQQSSPNDATNSQNVLTFKTSAYAFCNPCNEQFEFIVCTHTCQTRPHNDMMQNNGLYAQNGLTSNGSMHDLSQYPYHNIQQQYPTHMPTQTTQTPSYAINSHMGPHLTQAQNTMYQTSPNLGNYLMMSSMILLKIFKKIKFQKFIFFFKT